MPFNMYWDNEHLATHELLIIEEEGIADEAGYESSSSEDSDFSSTSSNVTASTSRITPPTILLIHAIILSARSSYFSLLLHTESFAESHRRQITIHLAPRETVPFLAMLRYHYQETALFAIPLPQLLQVCLLSLRFLCYHALRHAIDLLHARFSHLSRVSWLNSFSALIRRSSEEVPRFISLHANLLAFGSIFQYRYPFFDLTIQDTLANFLDLSIDSLQPFRMPTIRQYFLNQGANSFLRALDAWIRHHRQNALTSDAAIITFLEHFFEDLSIHSVTRPYMVHRLSPLRSAFSVWQQYPAWYLFSLQSVYLDQETFPSTIDHYPTALRSFSIHHHADNCYHSSPIILSGFTYIIIVYIQPTREVSFSVLSISPHDDQPAAAIATINFIGRISAPPHWSSQIPFQLLTHIEDGTYTTTPPLFDIPIQVYAALPEIRIMADISFFHPTP